MIHSYLKVSPYGAPGKAMCGYCRATLAHPDQIFLREWLRGHAQQHGCQMRVHLLEVTG